MRRRDFLVTSAGGVAASALMAQSSGANSTRTGVSNAETGIFPSPETVSVLDRDFAVTADVSILVPREPSGQDLFLARGLRNELADWFGLILKIERTDHIQQNQRAVVMGDISNPLVQASVRVSGFAASDGAAESYRLHIRPDRVIVAGADSRGALFGMQSLRQLLRKQEDRLSFQGVDIQDRPNKPFRGLKLYLPGRANIAFFKRFIRDFMALHKYNTLIMEMNAGMRLETHLELNAGWRELVEDTNYTRRNYPPGSLHGREQNSSHQDTADGGFLEKQQVAELAAWVRSHGIELIPELPSFTHSYYLLSRHKELTEVPDDKWPDTYCPSDSRTYDLLFDVYDEYLDLLKPRMLHVGHDELFAPVGLCPRCKDKEVGERYGEDVERIHGYLRKKNVRMAMWGDMLLQSVRGKGLRSKRAPDGWEYKVAGGLTPEQVQKHVPKDTLIFNWFWHKEEGLWSEEQAENNEAVLSDMGFEQIFGNFAPAIENYEVRSKRPTLLGAAPSAWFATNEFNFGKNTVSEFLGCSNIVWSGKVIEPDRLREVTQSRMFDIRARFRGELPPSSTEAEIVPLNISRHFNANGSEPGVGFNLADMRRGTVSLRRAPFDLAVYEGKSALVVATRGAKDNSNTNLPAAIQGINMGVDATSLIFLHASAKPASNQEPDRLLWDVPDSADLLGWYEVVYEDGFVHTVPIRYGVNIAEWNWATRKGAADYCYGADPVQLSGDAANPITFFAFEWPNPRLGQVIRELRMKGTTGFRGADPDFTDHFGPPIPSNAVILKAVSVVKKRSADVPSRS